jgi:dinuclear metal center YbgI/SA1388 family protein
MKISEVTQFLESLAPLSSQESYDNAGLIVGNATAELTQALICLDSTEEVVDEAIATGCNLIIAHHPIVFRGLKSLTGRTYIERVVMKCIKHDIALYAIHTNLDNYRFGVNYEIGKRLNLTNLHVLEPKQDSLTKLVVYVPKANKEEVLAAMYESGAGQIGNYKECSFSTDGVGTFTPVEGANPTIGSNNEASAVEETKIEVLVSNHLLNNVVRMMLKTHPYEEVAYDLIPLKNANTYEGVGMVGELKQSMKTEDFFRLLKQQFQLKVIRHTKIVKSSIKKVAFCGGSGSFLLKNAQHENADIYITGDFKYHEFFDAEDKIIIADIGHFESEQYTINLLSDVLIKKFPNFAFRLTNVNTNPINYF